MASRVCLFFLLILTLQAQAPAEEFPAPFNTEEGSPPVAGEDGIAGIHLPPGFKADLVAAEPDVQNPIALTFDPRGRLWVAENFTYGDGRPQFDLSLRDRILIFEDADGDGRFESRRIFTDQLNMLTSVEWGRGGVWVLCPPRLLFIPDRDGDDVPDGIPEVVLDGFRVPLENYHTLANGLKWGPDGWLYGRCGCSSAGDVGVPGTSDESRVPLRGTMWRVHPETRVFEALSCGTTNPWGHDWDRHGELFFINTVNGHLWHGIVGAHYMRPHTQDPHPFAYELIDQHADHYHFDTGQGWMKSRDGAANHLGGGHAHAGCVIYQGGAWPAEYCDNLYTINLHGRRINREVLKREGSGYIATHGGDFVIVDDPWFRGIDLASGPDGSVFALDWSDTGECHERTGVHRTSGRIYRIIWTGAPAESPSRDLGSLPSRLLAVQLKDKNVWISRQATRVLSDRSHAGDDLPDAMNVLEELWRTSDDVTLRLKALWGLWQTDQLSQQRLLALLDEKNEHVRAWGVRLLTDRWPLDYCDGRLPTRDERSYDDAVVSRLEELAIGEPSALVRLTLASTLQRLPVERRASLARALMAHTEDAEDHNLPLLVWYGLAPLGSADPDVLAGLVPTCTWSTTRRLMARRLAQEIERNPQALNGLLAGGSKLSPTARRDVLQGMTEGLAGWRRAAAPQAWPEFVKSLPEDEGTQALIRGLNVLFGDGRALDEVKALALDDSADMELRKQALASLIESRDPEVRSVCERLLRIRFLNTVALRGLAQSDDPQIARRLLEAWSTFAAVDRPQVIEVLATRPQWATALLSAMERGQIARENLSAFQARQIRNLGTEELQAQLSRVWGEIRESDEARRHAMAQLKKELGPDTLRQANLQTGRALFAKSCASCHLLYGEGGRRGPDLTGAQRQNLDYLLENILDPGALVPAEYRVSLLALDDGRVLTGIVSSESEKTITLLTPTESLTIEKSSIEERRETPQSLMPDGLLQQYSAEQIRDLFGYLMGTQQVPLESTVATP